MENTIARLQNLRRKVKRFRFDLSFDLLYLFPMHLCLINERWRRFSAFRLLSFGIFLAFLLRATLLYGADPIPVVATLPVLKDFTEKIGGSYVRVDSLITGLESEHTYTPKPSDVAAIQRARLLIKIGLGLEVWVNALIENADRPDLMIVTTSDGVPLIRDPSESTEHPIGKSEIDKKHAFKERHTMGNPHIWLDPENVKIMIRHITEGLMKIDPTHNKEYLQNQSRYIMELESLERELKKKVEPLKNRNLITHHPAWPYFARRFGFNIKGDIFTQVGSEPSAKHIGELIKQIKNEKIKVIISEPQLNPKIPEMLAGETGAKVVILSPLPGALPGTANYLEMIRYDVETLVSALGGP
jgi:ABC-type Zn uptake system ZnuABC Zn-binding protein ZnuA